MCIYISYIIIYCVCATNLNRLCFFSKPDQMIDQLGGGVRNSRLYPLREEGAGLTGHLHGLWLGLVVQSSGVGAIQWAVEVAQSGAVHGGDA